MSNHIKIDEDFVKSLLRDAAWDKAHVSLKEEDATVKVEESEEHICPLCESKLDEELSDETVLEHVNMINDLLEVNTKGPDVGPNPGMDRAKALAKKGQADVAKKDDDEPDDTDEKEKVNAAKKAKIKEDDEEEEEEAPDVNAAKKAKIKEKVRKLKEKWAGKEKGDDDDDDNGDPKAFGGKKGDKSKTDKGKDFEKKA